MQEVEVGQRQSLVILTAINSHVAAKHCGGVVRTGTWELALSPICFYSHPDAMLQIEHVQLIGDAVVKSKATKEICSARLGALTECVRTTERCFEKCSQTFTISQRTCCWWLEWTIVYVLGAKLQCEKVAKRC